LVFAQACKGGIAWYQMQHARVSTSDQDPGGQLEALRADAAPQPRTGYLLTVACPCGLMFERWVTPEEADADCFVSQL
jgi:hypothetical protein